MVGYVALGVVTWIALVFVSAPYGRHARPGWGPTVPARAGWILMEAPSAVGFAAVFAAGAHRTEAAPLALAAMWLLHYGWRAFVYPFLVRGRPMPLSVVALGAGFNVFNGPLNAWWIGGLHAYPSDWLTSPAFVVGAIVFAAGFCTHQHADAVLRALRRPGETGYRVPVGGLYRWVSCPNYLGELVAWVGFAIASASPAAAAFAFYTAANLVPRALSHHRWYRATFPDYPPERRAILPFVL